jgi:hypothetical protein
LLNPNGILATDDHEKSNLFSTHFSKNFTPHHDLNPTPQHDETIDSYLNVPLPVYLTAKPITPSEIVTAIKNLHPKNHWATT